MNFKRFKAIFHLFCAVIAILIMGCKKTYEVKKYDIYIADKDDLQLLVPPSGMVWIPPKEFIQGAKKNDVFAMNRERPGHYVKVDGFFIDATEVTNKQFKTFVDATNYITTAERKVDWEKIKEQFSVDVSKPNDSLLRPGSLVFDNGSKTIVDIGNYYQWWIWKIGADWKHPNGPDSSIEGKDNYPVVHVSYEDALAYCKWANRRLPTEAEWESAAQGINTNAVFTWGDAPELITKMANTWQGEFPVFNDPIDGFEFVAPVKSYEPNSIGLHDMIGNVWEMTGDFFDINHYKTLNMDKVIFNPKGAKMFSGPTGIKTKEYVIKGGSFLCNASYCASYRISAKMGMSPDSSADHIGFRTVVSVDMLKNQEN